MKISYVVSYLFRQIAIEILFIVEKLFMKNFSPISGSAFGEQISIHGRSAALSSDYDNWN